MTKRKYGVAVFIAILLLSGPFLAGNANAQGGEQGYYIRAEKLFEQKKYYEAIQYYEKYLGSETTISSRSTPFAVQKKVKGKSNLNIHNEAVYHLAESYRQCHNYSRAEKWYKEATSFTQGAYPEALYWYGVTLRANKKYDEAVTAINAFRESHKEMDQLLTGADRELENLQFIRAKLSKPKEDFFVRQLRQADNASAYAMTTSPDNKIVFTSVSGPTSGDGMYTANLYEADLADNEVGQKEKLRLPGDKTVHEGLATFNRRGDKMLFTKWTEINGIKTAAIYRSDKTDTGWSKPVKAPEPVNVEGFNSTQPFITDDGKYLLFASDRPGGVGKYDIWYATLDSNLNTLLVANTGNIVNTAEDELSPSYHQISRTMLYSSNGLIGMGGFDVFAAKGDFQLSNWEKPYNAGSPINSSKDDLYYISTDADNLWNTGIFSSDRSSECCLDMFAVRQDNAQFISGTVADCETGLPIPGATLTVTDPKHSGKILYSQKTAEGGAYKFQLKNTSKFDIKADMEGYLPTTKNFTVHFDTGNYVMENQVICLTLVVKDKTNPLQDKLDALTESATLAKFSYNKASLGNGSFRQLDSLIEFMHNNPSVIIEIGGYTDSKGSEAFNIKLAQKRVDACIKYLLKNGIDKTRLVGKAYGECCPIEPETRNGVDDPAARQKNRRVEYKIVE